MNRYAKIVGLSASLVFVGSSSAGALSSSAVEDIPVTESTKSAPAPVKTKGEVGTDAASAVQATCEFHQRVDNAHVSNTSVPRAVHAHGNWGNVNCFQYQLATVTTQVDKRNSLGYFYAVGDQARSDLAPNQKGLTSSNRVTARYVCNGLGASDFRAWTDIDVHGIVDAPNKVYSNDQNGLLCG